MLLNLNPSCGWRWLPRAMGLVIIASFAIGHPAFSAPPNFILILADDLGYGDLSCYGSQTIATPRLDRMAREGMKFTDFYVAAPFCSPSRAAMMTGRLPARCGVPYVLFPSEHTGLPAREITVAEQLKAAGYATALVGKWHLGWRRELRPTRQGFDEFFGLLHTNDANEWAVGKPFLQLSMFEPLCLREGDRIVEQPLDQAALTQRYTDRALDFITRHRDGPFFLFLSHTMPHVPQYASPAFEGKSKEGLYGDCIEELDHHTGRLLDHLQKLGLAEKTLVLFISDNGANRKDRFPATKRPPKPGEANRVNGGSNGPLRGGKGGTFEGGIRVPCVAWWPGSIPAGRMETNAVSALDFFPTFSQLAGVPLPEGLILDGHDISGVLRGKPNSKPRTLYHYFGVQLQAVREGPWKLLVPISNYPLRRVESLWFVHQPAVYENQHRLWPKPTLYHLPSDPGEQQDVAAEHADVVNRLLTRAREFAEAFQRAVPEIEYLPGPKAPAARQVRSATDDIRAWTELNR
jgi:arylsulfatase A-like enzyme